MDRRLRVRDGMGLALAFLVLVAPALAEDPKVELGRRLFMDPTVSREGKFSCSSCHNPEHGFSDARKLSEDENGPTRRHSQPIVDLVAGQPLHWDGEFGSVSELLTARLGSPNDALAAARESRTRRFNEAEAAGQNPDRQEFERSLARLQPPYYGTDAKASRRAPPAPVELRLAEDGRYDRAFQMAFGNSASTNARIVGALDAYVASLRSGESPYDRYLAGDKKALTAEQLRGLAVFTGKADCASCHRVEGKRPSFTDGAFHNTGVTFRLAELEFGGSVKGDGGAGEISCVREDLGRFKTPSLRDVATRPPYMHDGAFATLEDVVRYYNVGGTPNRHLDAHVRPLRLADGEVEDLVAFLGALTSDERPGLGVVPPGPREARIRVLGLDGKPLRSFLVVVRPAGDRLRGARSADQTLVTDSRGYVTVKFPACTHVKLTASGHEIHYDRLIPDSVRVMDVMAAPLDAVALRLTAFEDLPPEFGAQDAYHGIHFKRVRKLGPKSGIYVTAKGGVEGPFLATLGNLSGGSGHELDLSGGWTEPIDLTRR